MIASPGRARWSGRQHAPANAGHASVALLPALFLLVHLPIGLAVFRDSRFAIAHALVAVLLGVLWATHGRCDPARVAYVVGYIIGAEVLWRMSGGQIAWELGKYATILLFTLWMIRNGRLGGPWLISLYLGLLLPSIFLTLQAMPFSLAREQISFNLAGPAALMVAAWFFSQVRFTPLERQRMCLAVIAPVMGIAAVTFTATVLNPEIAFGSESSVEASGGFGPNQVSAMLGLGALLALLAMAEDGGGWGFRPMMVAVLIFLAMQSAFTFSRGGLYSAGAAALLGSLYLVRDARTRFQAIGAALALGLLGYYVIFPVMDGFTGGALSSRFADTGLTNRDTIVSADLQIWQEHPLLGVGPGRGNEFREAYIRNTPAHTEYTRMLAEHGVFGLISIVCVFGYMVQVARHPRPLRENAIVAALFAWSVLFQLSYGMRLAAPSFVFGVACLASSVPLLASRAMVPLRRGVVASARRGSLPNLVPRPAARVQ